MRGLKDQVVIVTGGAGGIGSATCKRLAQEGAKVAIFDLDLNKAQALQQELEALGTQALAVACDITQRDPLLA